MTSIGSMALDRHPGEARTSHVQSSAKHNSTKLSLAKSLLQHQPFAGKLKLLVNLMVQRYIINIQNEGKTLKGKKFPVLLSKFSHKKM